MIISELTDTQLERLYRKAHRRMSRGDGYQPWGWDWPTLKITKPGWARTLRTICDELETRGLVRSTTMTDLKTVVAERFKIPVKQASASILHHACRVTPPGEKAFLTSDPDTEVTPGTVIVTPSLSGNVTIEVK